MNQSSDYSDSSDSESDSDAGPRLGLDSLSSSTLSALQEFLAEKQEQETRFQEYQSNKNLDNNEENNKDDKMLLYGQHVPKPRDTSDIVADSDSSAQTKTLGASEDKGNSQNQKSQGLPSTKLKSKAGDISLFQENWGLSQFWYSEDTACTLARAIVAASKGTGTVAILSAPTLYSALKELNPPNFNQIVLFEYDTRFETLTPNPTKNFVKYDYRKPLDVSRGCDLILNQSNGESGRNTNTSGTDTNTSDTDTNRSGTDRNTSGTDHCSESNKNNPLQNMFDVIYADPPYLNKNCVQCVAKTMSFLARKKKHSSDDQVGTGDAKILSDDCKLLYCTGYMMRHLVKEALDLDACVFRPEHEGNLANPFRCYVNFQENVHLKGIDIHEVIDGTST